MKIDDIINQALTRLNQEQELRRLTILELLYKNIDSLLQNAPVWFGDNVPDEFKRVVRSFMTLSTSFLSEEHDYRDMIFDDATERVYIIELIQDIAGDMEKLFEKNSFTVECTDDSITVMTSLIKLKKSITSILLSFMVFMDKNSNCIITVNDDVSNVIVSMSFDALIGDFPGIDKIQQAFFSYRHDEDVRVGMGIDFALYRLRNIGVMTRVKPLSYGKNGAVIALSFPSMSFRETMEDIRQGEQQKVTVASKGSVIVVTGDFVMEMVLGELLHNNGYNLKSIDFDTINKVNIQESRVLIVDFSSIINTVEVSRFKKIVALFSKVLIIHGDGNADRVQDFSGSNVRALPKPIDIDRIIKAIEE